MKIVVCVLLQLRDRDLAMRYDRKSVGREDFPARCLNRRQGYKHQLCSACSESVAMFQRLALPGGHGIHHLPNCILHAAGRYFKKCYELLSK